MFDLAPQLAIALRGATEQLGVHATETARAQTNLGGGGSNRTMAALAESAIFSEALLTAIRARLQEIKAVTK